jgi:hypothetical protein
MSTHQAERMFAEAGLRLHGHHSHGHQPPLTHDPPHRHGAGWWPAGTGPFRPGPGSATFGARMPETHRPGVVTGPTGQHYFNTTGGDYGWSGRRAGEFDLPPNVGSRVPPSHRSNVRRLPTGEYAYDTTGGDYGWAGRRVDAFDQPPNVGCGVGSSQRWYAVTRLGQPSIGAGISPAAALAASVPVGAAANKRVNLTTAQAANLKALMIAALAPKLSSSKVTFEDLIKAGKFDAQKRAKTALTASSSTIRQNIAWLMMTPAQQQAYLASTAEGATQALNALGFATKQQTATADAARRALQNLLGGGAPSSGPPGGGGGAGFDASLNINLPQPSIPQPSASANFKF